MQSQNLSRILGLLYTALNVDVGDSRHHRNTGPLCPLRRIPET